MSDKEKPPVFTQDMISLSRKMGELNVAMMQEIWRRRDDKQADQKGLLSITTRADLYGLQQQIRKMIGLEPKYE